jgi:3-deoxy-D-manno-octulosonic-acid transferase
LKVKEDFSIVGNAVYILYSIVVGAVFLALTPVYFVKLRLLRGQPLRLAERFGFRLPRPRGGRPFLWIHAVSVGEVLSLQKLLREVRASHPGWEIGFSTLTNAGFAVAREKLREADHLFLVPADIGWCVRRVFDRLRPGLLVLAESEFWPRLLREAERRGCPVLLVNGRISARSFRRLCRFRGPARRMLGKISRFLVQTPEDRSRLAEIGVDPGRVEVSGNLKCDVRLPALSSENLAGFRREIGLPEGKKVVVAGSIHRGEEGPLLRGFREARLVRGDVLLVLAPRHPDKFDDLDKEPAVNGLVLRRRTRLAEGEAWDILFLDTIGELARFYALSTAAFIGGSLVPRGGQNLLEPAFYGKPVFFGPHMENFASLAEAFLRGGAARTVETPEEIAEVFLFRDLAGLEAMGRNARAILESLQGATGKTMAALNAFMGKAGA